LHKSARIFASNIYIEGTKCGIFSETSTPITAEFNKISFWDSASVLSERADPTALPGDPTFTGEIRAYDVERGYELFETSTTLAPTQRHLRHLVHYTGGAANWVMNRMTCAGSIYVENRSSSAISFTDGTATRFGSTTQIPGLASGEIRYFDRGLKYKVLSFG
jgi:hypothetical protein